MKSFKTFLLEAKLKDLKPMGKYDPNSKEWKSFDNPRYDCVKRDRNGELCVRSSRHPYVYHGTTMKDAQAIKKAGVRSKGISFTGNPYEGRGYAHSRAKKAKTDGALIRIHKKYLRKGKIEYNDNPVDQNMYFTGAIPKKAIEIIGRSRYKEEGSQ